MIAAVISVVGVIVKVIVVFVVAKLIYVLSKALARVKSPKVSALISKKMIELFGIQYIIRSFCRGFPLRFTNGCSQEHCNKDKESE